MGSDETGLIPVPLTAVAPPPPAPPARPAAKDVVHVLALSFVIQGLSIVPTALLNRNLRFRLMASIDLTAALIGGVAGVTAAILGANYWAMVIWSLASSLVSATVVLVLAPPS